VSLACALSVLQREDETARTEQDWLGTCVVTTAGRTDGPSIRREVNLTSERLSAQLVLDEISLE